jgi:hypothetical protein
MPPAPSETVPNAELLRSLARLVRGLSALFWGLPIGFIVCYYSASTDDFRNFGILPPLVCTGVLVYGLWQLGGFQRQERVWRNALDRARLFALVNFGLSPFLYWWHRLPSNPFFAIMVLLVMVCALLFLASLNLVLQRLGAMLPDEALRIETKQFTRLNLNLIGLTLVLGGAYFGLSQLRIVPLWLGTLLVSVDSVRFWLLIPLVLLPLAMTMALLWKTKEVILDSVFGGDR